MKYLRKQMQYTYINFIRKPKSQHTNLTYWIHLQISDVFQQSSNFLGDSVPK